MKLRPKVLLTTLAVAAFSAALMAPIAAAGNGTMMGGTTTDPGTGSMLGGGTTDPGTQTGTGTMMGGTTAPGTQAGTMMGTWDGSGPWGGTGMWGMGSGMTWLADDPAATQAWLQLRTEHHQDMQAWYETHKADLTTPAAQQALHDLWIEHWNDMKSFYEQYAQGADWTSPADTMWNGWQMGSMMNGGTWDATHMWGSGYGASWMTGHPGGMGRWLALRSRQMDAMNAWWQQNGAAPGSPAAQAALKTLMAQQRTQVKRFYRQHHLSAGSAMMRAGAGGWMGLGGMWGGFGW